ncbi:hypothetical protein JZL89_20585, partial [Providencia rettgeri]|uniref:hypothetical protein n=1 Tax=Providencia rettgeri TaxID=587 RepID=UPI0019D2585E
VVRKSSLSNLLKYMFDIIFTLLPVRFSKKFLNLTSLTTEIKSAKIIFIESDKLSTLITLTLENIKLRQSTSVD